MGVVIIFFLLNIVISSFNAWGCGATWDSTKAKGGVAHFMNWMGAVMSASGFTWCYTLLLCVVGMVIPAQWFAAEGEILTGALLDPTTAQAVFDLGYMAIIFPVLGSGLAITLHSWRSFARSRSAGDGLVAGWNTVAQVHNIYEASRAVPAISDRLGSFFEGESDGKAKLVIALAAVALFGGILTTYAILQTTRRSVLVSASA